MANERMDQKPSGTAYLDDIVITAHPTTGVMAKVTVAALLAASTNRPGGGGGDVTAPTVVSATVENANPNQVVVVFSESVTVTTAGWSFRRNTASWAISSVAGSGTTWTFTMATSAANGETLDRSYNSATGATVDGSANELASFTNSSVTNNVGGSYQAESTAFFAVNTGLTTGEKNAVDALVVALKAIGWSKFKAVYPFVGGTAAAHKWNLIDPQDTDGAFRLIFTGTWTHNANGVTGSTDTYANTHLVPATHLADKTSTHISLYSRTNTNPSGEYDIDSQSSGEMRMGILCKLSGDAYSFNGGTRNVAATTSQRLFVNTRTSATVHKLFQDGTQLGTTETADITASTANSRNTYLGVSVSNGTPAGGTNAQRNYAFMSIGSGLTDGEVTSLTTAVNAYQTALSRNV